MDGGDDTVTESTTSGSAFCSGDTDEMGVVLQVTDYADEHDETVNGISGTATVTVSPEELESGHVFVTIADAVNNDVAEMDTTDINIINSADFLQPGGVNGNPGSSIPVQRFIKRFTHLAEQSVASRAASGGGSEGSGSRAGRVLDVLVSTGNQALIPVSVGAFPGFDSGTAALIDPADDVIVTADMSTNGCGVAGSSSNWITSRTDKRTLHEHGHTWRQGQWSNEENEILRNNIDAYCKEKGIPDPNSIIFEMSKDMRKDFYRLIAQGLDRPLFSVYRRVIRMYDQKNHIGKYTPQEITRLRELRRTHGNDWAKIGAELGRSAGSVRDRCRLMKESCQYGTWKPDEEYRLANAVYELTGAQPGQEVHHGLCWADVALRVKTRTDKQCRAKWLNFLNWKQKGGTDWHAAVDDGRLLDKIVRTNANSENQVDWSALSRGWACVRSPQWLRSKWWSLKRQVPGYQTLPFRDLLSSLKVITAASSTDRQLHRLATKPPGLGQALISVNSVSSAVVEEEGEDSCSSVATDTTTHVVVNSSHSSNPKYVPLQLMCDGTSGSGVGGGQLQVQLPNGTHAVLSEDLCLDSSSLQFISSPVTTSTDVTISTSLPTSSSSAVGSLLLTNSSSCSSCGGGGAAGGNNSSTDAYLFPLSGGIAAEQQLIVHAFPIVSTTDPELGEHEQIYACHVEGDGSDQPTDEELLPNTGTPPSPISPGSSSALPGEDETASDCLVKTDPGADGVETSSAHINSDRVQVSDSIVGRSSDSSSDVLLLDSRLSPLPDPLLTDH